MSALAPALLPQSPLVDVKGATDASQFAGGTFHITHRDTNAILNLELAPGASIKTKSGTMVHMSGSVVLTSKVTMSAKKLFTGGQLTESTYTGPGQVALAPTLFGDIITLPVDSTSVWTIGKDAYLASTPEVKKDTVAQSLSKALFSGESLFVYRLMGQGTAWLTSFGAVERLELGPDEQHVVDNGHLVAWNCNYVVEKAAGGLMATIKSGEGFVCRFTGPGAVYIQTRNMHEFKQWIIKVVPRR